MDYDFYDNISNTSLFNKNLNDYQIILYKDDRINTEILNRKLRDMKKLRNLRIRNE